MPISKPVSLKYADEKVNPCDEEEIRLIQEQRNVEARQRGGLYFTYLEAKDEYFTKKKAVGLNRYL